MTCKNQFYRAVAGQLLAAAGLGVGSVAIAAESADQWQFEVTPYFLAASLDATIGIGDIEADVEVDANDLLDAADSGFMAMAVARKGKWVFAFDGSYIKLVGGSSGSVTGPNGRLTADGDLELTSRQWIYQPMAGYRVLDNKLKLDVYGGARYTRLRANVDFDADLFLEILDQTASTSFERSPHAEISWTDAVVGGHVMFPINDKLSLTGLADVGAGEDCDLSYQVMAAARWQFNERFSASGGYRVIYQDYAADNFSWEVTYSGVILGMGIAF